MDIAERLFRDFADTKAAAADAEKIRRNYSTAVKKNAGLEKVVRGSLARKGSGRYEVSYDFASPRQRFDFRPVSAPSDKDASDEWTIHGGRLHGKGKKGYQWQGDFVGDVEVRAKITIQQGGASVNFHYKKGKGYEVTLEPKGPVKLTFIDAGKRTPIANGKPKKPVALNKPVSLKITCKRGEITVTVNGERVIRKTSRKSAHGAVILWAYESDAFFDDLAITGKFDRNWLDKIRGK
jgi:hypothetical protein